MYMTPASDPYLPAAADNAALSCSRFVVSRLDWKRDGVLVQRVLEDIDEAADAGWSVRPGRPPQPPPAIDRSRAVVAVVVKPTADSSPQKTSLAPS